MSTMGGGLRLTYQQKIIVASTIVFLALVLLFLVRSILSPFLWAAVAAYVLNPVVNWVSWRTRIHRIWVIVSLYIMFGVAFGWALYNLIPFIVEEARQFRDSIPAIIGSLQEGVLGSQKLVLFGISLDSQSLSAAVIQMLGELPRGALRVVRETATFFGQALVFLVATFYLLADAPRISSWFFQLFPESYRPEAEELVRRINRILGAYIRGLLFLIVLMSTATWIFLGPILQVRFALILSLMTGILEIIPIIGPITAGAIATSVGFFQPNHFGLPNWAFALLIVIVYFVLRNLEDYLVIPNVIGRVVDLHPLLVIFSVFSGVVLGGILGMLLAIPVAAAAKVLLGYAHAKMVS
jgi:predicted PurR-regulated permease PerM